MNVRRNVEYYKAEEEMLLYIILLNAVHDGPQAQVIVRLTYSFELVDRILGQEMDDLNTIRVTNSTLSIIQSVNTKNRMQKATL